MNKTGKKYPYYRCPNSKCKDINIRKEKVEKEYLTLLESLKPQPEYMELLNEMIIDVWRSRERDKIAIKNRKEKDIKKYIKQKERLTNSLAEGFMKPIDYKNSIDKIDAKLLAHKLELQDLKVEIL